MTTKTENPCTPSLPEGNEVFALFYPTSSVSLMLLTLSIHCQYKGCSVVAEDVFSKAAVLTSICFFSTAQL